MFRNLFKNPFFILSLLCVAIYSLIGCSHWWIQGRWETLPPSPKIFSGTFLSCTFSTLFLKKIQFGQLLVPLSHCPPPQFCSLVPLSYWASPKILLGTPKVTVLCMASSELNTIITNCRTIQFPVEHCFQIL